MLARIIAEIIFPFAILSRKIDLWRLGIKVKINKIGPGWMQGVVLHTMDLFWHPIGIQGVNCWTIGNVDKNGKSTRYDEESNYFQSWFGSYIIKSNNQFGIKKGTKEIKILDYNKLSMVDQNNWLNMCLNPNSPTTLDYKTVKFIKKIKIASGHTCHLFSGEYVTTSDNSNKTKSLSMEIYSILNYKQFGGKKDFFKPEAFLPKYDDKTPFKPIRLKGYFGIVPFFDKQRHVVFYGCGIKKNFNKIKNEIISMIKSSEIKTRF
ncbi:MAG: hypothetical protein DRP06_02530 [Candidatus Aenigmatarchaeota archaeon]|nr:MAG: hypothetical protein DRP06_02530 [Candidatus Aenigmarchaeota archaeon]